MKTPPLHQPVARPDAGRLSVAFLAVALLAGALPPAVARAQNPSPCPPLPRQQPCVATPPAAGDTVALTLDEALSLATGESQEIRLARSNIALADAQVTAARSAALPQLDGSINYTRTFDSPFNTGPAAPTPDSLLFEPDTTASLGERVRYLEEHVPNAGIGGLGSLFGNLPFGRANSYVAALSGSQPLYSGGRVGAAMKIAGEYREAARFGLDEEVAEIVLQTRSAYLRALLAQELERIAAAALEQAESFLVQERLRLETGTTSELAVLRAEVSLANLRPNLVEARNAASLATLDLKRLVDLPLSRPVALTTPLQQPTAAELAEARVAPELLLSSRAAVQAAERQVAIREQQVRIARGAHLPSVDLRVNYGRQLFPDQIFDFTGQRWRTDFTAVVGVSVPIFSGFRAQAEVQQARIALDQERLRVAQLREDVQLQYEQALGEKQRAAADLSARQLTVDQAQRVHDLTVLRYEQGLATQLEVSDARLSLLQSRTNFAQAIADFHLADASVVRALGHAGSRVRPAPSSPSAPPASQSRAPSRAP
ncbi:MAG: TolC family protein [Gemmatimonadaceae bacterium]